MSGYGATSASSRKIKVTMREHEGGDKVQRNCCFMFALVVGGLAAAFVAHGQRETSLSLEWTETDVVAVKAGNRIHYDDDVADDTTSSSDTENYSFWGFVSKCDDSTKVLQVLLKIVGVWPFVLLGLVALAQHPSLRRRKASENFVLLLCHAGLDFPPLFRARLSLFLSRASHVAAPARRSTRARCRPISRQMVAHVHLVHFGVRDRAAAFLIHRERHGNEGPRDLRDGLLHHASDREVRIRPVPSARAARAAHMRAQRAKRTALRACARTRYGTYFIFAGLATLLALGQVRGPLVRAAPSLSVSTAAFICSRPPRTQIMHNLMARERRYLEAVVRNQVRCWAPAAGPGRRRGACAQRAVL